MKKPLKIILIVVGVLLILGIVGATITITAMNSASNSSEYKIGNNTIPSIKAVLGKRSVNGVSTETSNNITKKVYTYSKIQDVNGDLVKYIKYLTQNNGFLAMTDFDLNTPSGTLQLGKNSSESGKVIILDIQWDMGTYSIALRSGSGSINKK
ncbi:MULTISPECIES: hypothetical protein [Clostridium]|uniref:DUF4860 domain-containing protein n=1 Tax=Clostridium frigoriphilum TaxID=443253 RepID=A0ABU7UQQ4_9CLOT|nr:hypothetical protein [Clostridium sp. DSM 17811]MBU3099288.1 hypothetical protein [Clostridium sp. DSM 17811]